MVLSSDDRALFEARLEIFRETHPESSAGSFLWSDVALRTFTAYLGEIREDVTAVERAQGVPLIADLAILDAAIAWARTCRKAKK